MRHYEFVDHTADIAIKAFGESLAEAFAVAAEAMFDIITDKSPVDGHEEVQIEVEADDLEGLLVVFLSRLIFVHEVDRLVLKDFRVELSGHWRLQATGRGEKFVSSKHGHGNHVKGVSYHMIEVFDGREKKPSHVQVLFDV
ncbi:MAG: archease [candidate division Zixibacteria bacterium]|nr:archease [candidate division Zixibacteria bacterium]